MSSAAPYIVELPNLFQLLQHKHILFDTSAIDILLKFKATNLLSELQSQECKFCYIHPIFIELMRTDTLAKRQERKTLLDDFEFQTIPLISNILDKAKDLQLSLSAYSCYPSPTDLYLGGTLAHFSEGAIFLLTSNVKDFPCPLFERAGQIIIQGDRNVQVLSLLALDHSEFAGG